MYAEGKGYVTAGILEHRDVNDPRGRLFLDPGVSRVLDLEVERAAVVGGRVLDAGGSPVVGAVVRAETDANDFRAYLSFGESPAVRAIAVTGPDGRFAFDRVVPGDVVALRAAAPGAGVRVVGPLRVSASAPIEQEIRLAPRAPSRSAWWTTRPAPPWPTPSSKRRFARQTAPRSTAGRG